jgi:molecular chaperone DnaK
MFSTAADNQPSVEVHVLQGEREMARDNRTLGRFHLTGIAPAPRGVPQIEVAFDIDANGIVNVSAKDMATGKEQAITITSSSGLGKEEVDRMVRDADSHREEDQKARERTEARNRLDALVYSTERSLEENRDKLDPGLVSELETALPEARQALDGDDLERMKSAEDRVTELSRRLADALYQKTTAGPQPGDQGTDGHAPGEGTQSTEEDVVDAEFQDVV